jgi:hypothetical protein
MNTNYKKKAWDDKLLYIEFEASPNAIKIINSPLPRLIEYRYPLSGERIHDKHERSLTAYPIFLIFLAISEFKV